MLLQTTKFKEEGVLTPEEFIAAGDHLVNHFGTWSWSSGGKAPVEYLPADKQFLVTRNGKIKIDCIQIQVISLNSSLLQEMQRHGIL